MDTSSTSMSVACATDQTSCGRAGQQRGRSDTCAVCSGCGEHRGDVPRSTRGVRGDRRCSPPAMQFGRAPGVAAAESTWRACFGRDSFPMESSGHPTHARARDRAKLKKEKNREQTAASRAAPKKSRRLAPKRERRRTGMLMRRQRERRRRRERRRPSTQRCSERWTRPCSETGSSLRRSANS